MHEVLFFNLSLFRTERVNVFTVPVFVCKRLRMNMFRDTFLVKLLNLFTLSRLIQYLLTISESWEEHSWFRRKHRAPFLLPIQDVWTALDRLIYHSLWWETYDWFFPILFSSRILRFSGSQYGMCWIHFILLYCSLKLKFRLKCGFKWS